MSVRIQLHSPPASYTNLDVISGSVFLRIQAPSTFSAITVKLEGESRTRLSGHVPGPYHDQRQRPTTELEVHKLLYKTQVVFPPPELQQNVSESSSFTLSPGQYEYPFTFKIPVQNSCTNNDSALTTKTLGGMMLEMTRDSNRHVRRTLPPSLSGFPGMAEIRYYLKATAVRPKFYQENLRVIHDFILTPMEPPRPPSESNEEIFAKRTDEFSQHYRPPLKTSVFGRTSSNNLDVDGDPPAFTVDARIPNPPVLTCRERLPLRVFVKKTNQSRETLFLSTLSIELFAFTNVRAHELTRTETGSWILTSQANIQCPLSSSKGPVDKQYRIPKRYFDQVLIPPGVSPSFETCNISRSYELEIRVGLNHGVAGNIKPELRVIQLRFQVELFSGISQRGSFAQPSRPTLGIPSSSSYHHSSSSHIASGGPSVPPPNFATPHDIPFDDDAPPPTYEEALAEDATPVADGPRPNYNPPPSPRPPMPPRPRPSADSGGGASSGKESGGGGVHRMPSERLFSGSGTIRDTGQTDGSDDDNEDGRATEHQRDIVLSESPQTEVSPHPAGNGMGSNNPFRRKPLPKDIA